MCLKNCSLAQLHTAPNPGEWSADQVLAHLRACADVWGGNILRMISEDRPAMGDLTLIAYPSS